MYKKNKYLYNLKGYLQRQKNFCVSNAPNLFFEVTLDYVNELESLMSDFDTFEEDNFEFDRKANKYIDFVEAYRLIKKWF